ncbi:MAG: RNA polymerase sigma factor [Actinomycetota bacterium]|jgi:RNA polymerase sigma-70 factor (ECF subfamily)|nr:RNA polymerase sigma factor [Actinomycetota bacterium]
MTYSSKLPLHQIDKAHIKELVGQAKAGRKEAFDELVRITYPRLLAVALRLTGNAEDAKDVLQEAYIRAFRSLKNYREEANFWNWMQTIIRNVASSLLARARRRRFEVIDGVDSNDISGYKGDMDQEIVDSIDLKEAMDELPSEMKRLVLLKDFYGFEHSEIANRLSISEANAKVRLHRARNALKVRLEQRLPKR